MQNLGSTGASIAVAAGLTLETVQSKAVTD